MHTYTQNISPRLPRCVTRRRIRARTPIQYCCRYANFVVGSMSLLFRFAWCHYLRVEQSMCNCALIAWENSFCGNFHNFFRIEWRDEINKWLYERPFACVLNECALESGCLAFRWCVVRCAIRLPFSLYVANSMFTISVLSHTISKLRIAPKRVFIAGGTSLSFSVTVSCNLRGT